MCQQREDDGQMTQRMLLTYRCAFRSAPFFRVTQALNNPPLMLDGSCCERDTWRTYGARVRILRGYKHIAPPEQNLKPKTTRSRRP
jgi:hypothetical protein